MDWTEVIKIIVGGGAGGALTYLGTSKVVKSSERVAAQQGDLDSRRVSIVEFNTFKEAYVQNREEDRKEIRRLRDLLVLSMGHVAVLRSTMRRHAVPVPPLPEDLVGVSSEGFDSPTTAE